MEGTEKKFEMHPVPLRVSVVKVLSVAEKLTLAAGIIPLYTGIVVARV